MTKIDRADHIDRRLAIKMFDARQYGRMFSFRKEFGLHELENVWRSSACFNPDSMN